MPELTRRYLVMPIATEIPLDLRDPEAAFVLKPWKDPAALRALETYRDNCYPELARELGAWIGAVKAGPTVRGGVGKLNDPHLRPAGKKAEPKSRARGGAKAKPKPRARARGTARRRR